jgi:hypothetical protein
MKKQVETNQDKTLLKSLAQFQYECPIIHKDTSGFNYTYADLPKIFSVITPLLKKNGLGITQLLEDSCIRTILFHYESGQTLESVTPIPVVELAKMNVYQSYGSGVTYYRRYAISSMLGLVTDKDIDGAGEQIKKVEEKKPVQQKKESGIAEMNDITMMKLVARYNAGEVDVFDRASEHFKLRDKDLLTIKMLQDDRTV